MNVSGPSADKCCINKLVPDCVSQPFGAEHVVYSGYFTAACQSQKCLYESNVSEPKQ